MGDATKGIKLSIESLLEDLWDEGYKIGQNDQWIEDEKTLDEEKDKACELGYDKGFEDGRASARKE